MRLSNSALTQAAETMLAAMAYDGVFRQAPEVHDPHRRTLGGWLPFLLMRLDQNTAPQRKPQSDLLLGEWPYEVSAGDHLRRNVRVSPLPGLGRDGSPTLL